MLLWLNVSCQSLLQIRHVAYIHAPQLLAFNAQKFSESRDPVNAPFSINFNGPCPDCVWEHARQIWNKTRPGRHLHWWCLAAKQRDKCRRLFQALRLSKATSVWIFIVTSEHDVANQQFLYLGPKQNNDQWITISWLTLFRWTQYYRAVAHTVRVTQKPHLAFCS